MTMRITFTIPATFSIPVEVVSEANARDHNVYRKNGRLILGKGIKRVKEQKKKAYKSCEINLGGKGWAYAHCLKHIGCKPTDDPMPGDFRITLTRIMGKGQKKYDDDNLASAFKAIRDAIAMYLGIDDGSDRLKWEYGQEKQGDRASPFGRGGWVEVEIERMESGNGE